MITSIFIIWLGTCPICGAHQSVFQEVRYDYWTHIAGDHSQTVHCGSCGRDYLTGSYQIVGRIERHLIPLPSQAYGRLGLRIAIQADTTWTPSGLRRWNTRAAHQQLEMP